MLISFLYQTKYFYFGATSFVYSRIKTRHSSWAVKLIGFSEDLG